VKGKKVIFTLETTTMEKPRKPLTRSAPKKLIPIDEILVYETYPYHEAKDYIEVQPPLGKRVMFSPKVLEKEILGRPITISSARRRIHVEDTRLELLVQCDTEEFVEVQSPSK
jgi:hypothetical protein